jgi:hypothetical protein
MDAPKVSVESKLITCYLCETAYFGPVRFLVDDYGKQLSVCDDCYENALDDEGVE